MLSDFRDVKSIPQYLRGPPFRGPPIQGPPPSLWNCTISQVHQEFPSYPRFTLAQGNHKGVSKVHHHLCGIQTFRRLTKNFLPIQDPPWPKETIKVYSKLHQGPPPSLCNTNISQVNQECPSYPISILAKGNHKDVFQGPSRSATISGVQPLHRFTKKFLPIQDPPWPNETINVYSMSHDQRPSRITFRSLSLLLIGIRQLIIRKPQRPCSTLKAADSQ